MGTESFWGESDDVREENIDIYRNSQDGLDRDGNPFFMPDEDDDDYFDFDEEDD